MVIIKYMKKTNQSFDQANECNCYKRTTLVQMVLSLMESGATKKKIYEENTNFLNSIHFISLYLEDSPRSTNCLTSKQQILLYQLHGLSQKLKNRICIYSGLLSFFFL